MKRAVETFGNSAFRGVAPPGGRPGELPFSEESRRAIDAFFTQADEQQLQQLIRDLQRIDQDRPIKWYHVQRILHAARLPQESARWREIHMLWYTAGERRKRSTVPQRRQLATAAR